MDMQAKLPVLGTFTRSYGFVWTHRRDLTRIGWLPLMLVFGVALYFGSLDPVGSLEADLGESGPVILNGLLGGLVQGAISVVVLVYWHRLVMREYKSVESLSETKAGGTPGWRESLYFLQMLLLSIVFLAIWIVSFFLAEFVLVFGYLIVGGAGAINNAGTDLASVRENPAFVVLGYLAAVIGMLPAFYVALRLSLALPETATGNARGRLSHSWAASAGNGWRMVFATVLVMSPVEAFNLTAGFLASANASNALHYPLVLLASVGLVVLMAVLGTVLSLCYAHLQSASAETVDGVAMPAAG